MFQCLDAWNAIPWIDPISKDIYPEIRGSMLQMKRLQNRRIERDRAKAEAEAKWKR